MSDTVEGRLKALAQRQGHPGSLNIADVGHMMQSWKQEKDDLERQLKRFNPFLKRVIEATKPYHENEDAPKAAETLFNIYEDAVMIRALAATPEEARRSNA